MDINGNPSLKLDLKTYNELLTDIIDKDYKKEDNKRFSILQMFDPFLKSQLKPMFTNKILCTTLDSFLKRFNITSDILDPMYKVWDKYGCNAILAGGKMVDLFQNKTKKRINW